MTPEQEKYYRTRRYILIGAIIAFIIIALLVWKGCQQEKAAVSAYDAIKERLEARIKDSSRVANELAKERKNNIELEFAVADLQSKYVISTIALRDKSLVEDRLRAEVRKAKANKDTVEYYANCDSLVEATEQSERHRQAALRQAAMIDSIRIEQIKGKNREIKILQSAYDSCMSVIVFVKNTLPAIKPRSKVYIEGAAKVGAVTGAGGGFSLVDTKGNKFSAKAYATTLGPVYEAGYGRLLSFKRNKNK